MKKFLLNAIVVPWDFSDMAKSALEVAIEMADRPDQIHVVYVTPYPAAMEPGVIWETITEDTIVDASKKTFEDYVESKGLADVRFSVMFGDPGSSIASYAQDNDAGLVVISSHGRTGLTRLMLGSVAERVVRLAPCPVLVLRGEKED